MPVFSALFGEYNVAASFNNWFYTNITANGTPSWMPSARVVFDWGKDNPLISGYSGHAFSLNHLGNIEVMNFQGKTVDNDSAGNMRQGQVEISTWVSRQQAGNSYMARLRQMRDMVATLFLQYNTVPIVNTYASVVTSPSATGRMILDNIDFTNPQADPVNPDIWRIRGLAQYRWTERV